jgi:hypothetical protein
VTTTLEFETKKSCIFGVVKFNSKPENHSHHVSHFCTSNECDEDSGYTSKRLLEDFSGVGEVEDTDGECKKGNISGATGVIGFKKGGLVSHCLFSIPSFYLSLVSLLRSLFLPTSVSSHFQTDKFLFSVLLSVLCSLFLPISVSSRFLSGKCLFVFLSFLHFFLPLCLRESTLCPLHFDLCVSFRCLSMVLSLLCFQSVSVLLVSLSVSLSTYSLFPMLVCFFSLSLPTFPLSMITFRRVSVILKEALPS